MSVSNGYCCRSGWHLTPPTLRHARATKVRSHVLYIHIYISDFHYLDLQVSRSLRSLANKYSEISIELHLRVSRSLRSLTNYKYSTLPRGISNNIAPKVGIFPEAEGRGKYSLLRVQYYRYSTRVEHLFYYIGYCTNLLEHQNSVIIYSQTKVDLFK